MAGVSVNFDFLSEDSPQLARLASLAEHYFIEDAPSCLIKLRQFAELMAKDIAARHGLLTEYQSSFDDVLRGLKLNRVLPREVADLFYHLKRVGNEAVHEDRGTQAEALNGLKVARSAAIWFHRSYGGKPNFRSGPFVPPRPAEDPIPALQQELENLRAKVRDSDDAQAKAAMALQDASAETEKLRSERQFWEQYASETETQLRTVRGTLEAVQAVAVQSPPLQLDLLAQAASSAADKIELDESSTRAIIDGQLVAAGWKADTMLLRHAAGVRPGPSEAIAIAEWPTSSGPVDYALFIDGICVGVIEAKRSVRDVPGRLGQAKRYARDILLDKDSLAPGAPWPVGNEAFSAPFTFVTNGRPYVKQLETKSGIWFWDARVPEIQPRALPEWFSPRDLKERLEQVHEDPGAIADREIGVTGLRPYQQEAIQAVEKAISAGQRSMLLAMATGTGKTRLAIALMYEVLRRKQFRRILFLVDRNALGRQTLDAMSTTDTSGFLKFDQIFPVADLAKKFPEATDRVQVATVQAMVRRLFEEAGEDRPTPGTYDLIIVDEAHRGYVLDAELREEDLGFRNLEDYLSAYRRVLDYFDATKIALTATPALHTREIFGPPVYRYGYRQAVIDGFLIDHLPPRRIITALSQTGIHFDPGEEVSILDPRTGEVDLFDLEDEVDFEVAEFNRKVYTTAFNRAVADAVTLECPPDQPGKTLLFAAKDDHADILVKELRAALEAEYGPQPHDIVEKITGSIDKPLDRIKVFKNDPRPKYVVTVDLLTTGIDVPAITNLVFVRRVNSRILYDQMIGRATRRCDEIGKEHFRIFDAVDIYANLQDLTDMRPVVVDPTLTFATLTADLNRAQSDEDKAFVRDQIVVKLRQRLKSLDPERRQTLETVLGSLPVLIDKLKDAPPAVTAQLFQDHPNLAKALDASSDKPRDGIIIAPHADEIISIEDDFGDKASPADFIESFEDFVRSNMNGVPAMVAAIQRPRELTRKDLKDLAVLLDEKGYSEASLRRAYGAARNADIAAHIIGYIRQAALHDALVPYEKRVENGVQKVLASRAWTAKQRQWLNRIGRALKSQPVGDPGLLADPLFAQAGGFEVVDREFDSGLGELLKDLNAAIWDSPQAA